MITLTREEAQQVLDALEAEHSAIYGTSQTARAIETLRSRLAEKEQEPVAWSITYNGRHCDNIYTNHNFAEQEMLRLSAGYAGALRNLVPLYTAPQKREWGDVSDAQLMDEVRRRGFIIKDAKISEWARLTFEEAMHIAGEFGEMDTHKEQYKFARAIEAALREKNT